jgi:hypothetical protein
MQTDNAQTPNFKPMIVYLILNKQTEQALDLLAKNYNVDTPKLKVGLPKGHTHNAYGTYATKNQTIFVLDSDVFFNPFVILHEFYHHLRSSGVDKLHRGTEKNADKFAIGYINAFQEAARKAAQGTSF